MPQGHSLTFSLKKKKFRIYFWSFEKLVNSSTLLPELRSDWNMINFVFLVEASTKSVWLGSFWLANDTCMNLVSLGLELRLQLDGLIYVCYEIVSHAWVLACILCMHLCLKVHKTIRKYQNIRMSLSVWVDMSLSSISQFSWSLIYLFRHIPTMCWGSRLRIFPGI